MSKIIKNKNNVYFSHDFENGGKYLTIYIFHDYILDELLYKYQHPDLIGDYCINGKILIEKSYCSPIIGLSFEYLTYDHFNEIYQFFFNDAEVDSFVNSNAFSDIDLPFFNNSDTYTIGQVKVDYENKIIDLRL